MAAVHVNHGIRGEAAREDARYVKELCRREGVPFYPVEGDVKRLAAEEKSSVEDAGRRLRYRALLQTMEATAGTRIAVAHNANDRAETMLLHLFRGSGLRGMCGIEPVRGCVVRPLLCLERREIEAYLRERGILWRTDSTNEEDEYTRNRVRHHILPCAEREVSSGVISHMCTTADILSETEDYLREQTEKARARCVSGEGIDVASFAALHPALRKRLLLELMEELSPTGKDIFAVHVDAALALFEREGNRGICLPSGICFRRQYGRVIFERSGSPNAERALPELEYSEIFLNAEEEVPINQYTKWFDCDKIEESLALRFRQAGDYLTISDGRGGIRHKSLKDYMITEKIPRTLRDSVPVLAEGSHVLWLVGYRISEYYKVGRNTRHVLQVQLKGSCEISRTEEKDGGAH